jgi:hypothetical protein
MPCNAVYRFRKLNVLLKLILLQYNNNYINHLLDMDSAVVQFISDQMIHY